MPGIRSTLAAYSDMVGLLASDPALVEKYKTARRSLSDTNGRDTMGLVSAKLLASEPRIAAIFAKAGTTPQQTTSTFETLLGVIFGEAMLTGAKADASKLPAFVADNLAFYRQNKPEIEAAFKAFAAKAQAIGGDVLDSKDDEDGEVSPDEEKD